MIRRVVCMLLTMTIVAGCTNEAGERAQHGRLVILDSSGNIVVMDPDGANAEQVTDDAGDNAGYIQPIWSTDSSRIAWGEVRPSGFAVGILSLSDDDRQRIPTPNLPFYLSWSPSGDDLGVLHNGTSGVAFQLIDVDTATARAIDEDAPYYFSWSPDGDRLVTHAGRDRVERVTTDGQRSRLRPTSPAYLAPQWTEAGIFHVVDDALVLEDESGDRVSIADVPGILTNFVANSRGSHVALQTTTAKDGSDGLSVSLEAVEETATGELLVIDVGSGDVELASEDPAVGFFWSPDGESLLILSLTADRSSIINQVWTSRRQSTEYSAYLPAITILRDTLPFFPQYAQSLSFWSPDSRSFTFTGSIGEEMGVWVQDLDQEDPILVSDGIWASWSRAG